MKPWTRIEIVIDLVRLDRRHAKLVISVKTQAPYPAPAGTEPVIHHEVLATFVSKIARIPSHLRHAPEAWLERVEDIVAPAANPLVRFRVVSRGTPAWSARMARLRWSLILADWLPDTVVTFVGTTARATPLLTLPLTISSGTDESFIDADTSRVEGVGWMRTGYGGHIVHVPHHAPLVISGRTRLVVDVRDPVRPASWAREHLLTKLVRRGRVSALRVVAPPPRAAAFLGEFHRSVMHDDPLDAAVASGMRHAKLATGAVRLDLLSGAEDSLRLRSAVVEQRIAQASLPAISFGVGAKSFKAFDGDIGVLHQQLDAIDFAHEDHGVRAANEMFQQARDERDIATSVANDRTRPDRHYKRSANLWLTDEHEREVDVRARALGVKTNYMLQFAIQERRRSTGAHAAIPAERLRALFDRHDTLEMTVSLFAPPDRIKLGRHRLTLALRELGDSDTLSFPMRPLLAGPTAVRACLQYQGSLIQSVVLRLLVAEQEEEIERSRTRGLRQDYAASVEDLATVKSKPVHLSLFFNSAVDGTHWIGASTLDGAPVAGFDDGQLFEIAPDDLTQHAVDVRAALANAQGTRVNGKPTRFPIYRYGGAARTISDDELKNRRDELVKLAKEGRGMFAALFEPAPVIAAGPQQAAPDRAKQVAAALARVHAALSGPDLILEVGKCHSTAPNPPWGMVYDFPLDPDAPNLKLCPVIDADLVAGGSLSTDPKRCLGQAECPMRKPNPDRVVCPFGFWGFRHELDQPPNQAAPGGKARRSPLQLAPSPVPVAAAVYAFDETKDHIANITRILKTVEVSPSPLPVLETPSPEGAARDAILATIRKGEHSVIYFFCHGDAKTRDVKLIVGTGDKIGMATVPEPSHAGAQDWKLDQWSKTTPLVFLNGCNTLAYEPDVKSKFLNRFMALGACGVIGTDIEVFTTIAAEVGDEVLSQLFAAGGKRLGRILLDVRRELLREYNPLGLAYVSYAPASLHIHRPGCWCEPTPPP